MSVEKVYRCNLCKYEISPDGLPGFAIAAKNGTDAAFDHTLSTNLNSSQHHICFACVAGLHNAHKDLIAREEAAAKEASAK